MPFVYDHSMESALPRLELRTSLGDGQSIEWRLLIPFGLAVDVQNTITEASLDQGTGEVRVQARAGDITAKVLRTPGHEWDVIDVHGAPVRYSPDRARAIVEHHPHVGFAIAQAVIAHVLSKKPSAPDEPSPEPSCVDNTEGPSQPASDSMD